MKKWNFVYKVSLCLVGALLLSTSTYAIPKEPCAPKNDMCCEDPAPGPFAFSYPKDIGLSCPRDFYVHGDFLVVKAIEQGLDFAVSQTYANAGNRFPLNGGDVKGFSTGSHDWNWNYGFRVGFGGFLNFDQWNLDLKWTYIHFKNDKSTKIQGTGMLLPLWVGPMYTSTDIKHASARWSGDLNTMDLCLGKPYHVSRYFVLNPVAGIRGAWIEQDFLARYGGTVDPASNYGVHMKAQNNFWGVGTRIGCETEFILARNWNIFANAYGAFLFGKFDVTQETTNDYRYNLDNDFYDDVANAEIHMGLRWKHYGGKDKNLFSIRIAYEFHKWWDQNQMRRFYDSYAAEANTPANGSPIANEVVSRGDLSFNGVTARIMFDF